MSVPLYESEMNKDIRVYTISVLESVIYDLTANEMFPV